jgi:hypothetical protein
MNVSDLDARIKRALHGNYALPAGALARIHLLLGGEEAAYVTAVWPPAIVAGEVTVLTRSRVVHATLWDFGRSSVDADVQAWTRSLLRTVSIGYSKDDNKVWDDVSDRWPDGAQLVLSYGDDARSITLPAAEGAGMDDRSDLWALIPSLLDDLESR